MTKKIDKYIKYIKPVVSILFGYFGTIGFKYLYLLNTDGNIKTNLDIINYLILIFISYFVYVNFNKIKFSKHFIFSLIFSLILSIILIIGVELDKNSSILWNADTLKYIFYVFMLILPLFYALHLKIKDFKLEPTKNINYKKFFIISFIVILITNIIIWLAVYPGIYGYDSIFHVNNILKIFTDPSFTMSNHYSLLYNYLLGGFVLLGGKIFSDYAIGYAIFMFIQAILISYVSAKISSFIYKYSSSKILGVLSIIFYSLYINYKILTVSSCQDIPYGAFFALSFMIIIEVFIDNDLNIKKTLLLIICLFLMCAFRNNGIYNVYFLIIFALFMKSGSFKKKILLILIGVVALNFIYTGPIYKLLGYDNTKSLSIQEASSVPTQQLARVLRLNKSAYSPDDLLKLGEYYNNLDELVAWSKYNPSISDNLKREINSSAVKNDLVGYFSLWLKIGVKDTKNYIEAFLMENIGFWYPNKTYPDGRMYHPLVEYLSLGDRNLKDADQYIMISRNSKIPFIDNFLNDYIYKNGWKDVSFVSIFHNMGIVFVTILYLIGLTILNKNYKLLIGLSMIICSYLVYFVSPVAILRYIYSIILIFPMVIWLILDQNKFINVKRVRKMGA